MSNKKERLSFLVEMAKSLTCGYCSKVFHGSYSQARKVRYENAVVYCGKECRTQSMRDKYTKRIEITCEGCSVVFEDIPSRGRDRKFCSQECYIESDFAKENRELALIKANEVNVSANKNFRKVNSVICPECGDTFYRQPSKIGAGFCSKQCAGNHTFADESMLSYEEVLKLEVIKPDSYSNFRKQKEVSCIIKGCSWVGHSLSHHLLQTHKVRTRHGKMIGGFNLSEGLISHELREKLTERAPEGVALDERYHGTAVGEGLGRKHPPASDESREAHRSSKNREGIDV